MYHLPRVAVAVYKKIVNYEIAYDLTDKELLHELVNASDETSEEIGVLPEYDLRFLKADDGRMRAIFFADISSEKAMMNGLIRNSLIIGLTGYAVFFVISLLLAKMGN